MSGASGTILAAAGTGTEVLAQLAAGHRADMAANVNAGTIAQTSELNAQLIEQGAALNAGVHDFNAVALENQAKDAIQRGKEYEDIFRKQIRGIIGSQRVSFAAQGVDIGDGSAAEVQADTAKQGELDAIAIRTNASREAWGYTISAEGERLQSASTRRLGVLQARNTRSVGQAAAVNARITGSSQVAASNWGAASTILASAASFANSRSSSGGIRPNVSSSLPTYRDQ